MNLVLAESLRLRGLGKDLDAAAGNVAAAGLEDKQRSTQAAIDANKKRLEESEAALQRAEAGLRAARIEAAEGRPGSQGAGIAATALRKAQEEHADALRLQETFALEMQTLKDQASEASGKAALKALGEEADTEKRAQEERRAEMVRAAEKSRDARRVAAEKARDDAAEAWRREFTDLEWHLGEMERIRKEAAEAEAAEARGVADLTGKIVEDQREDDKKAAEEDAKERVQTGEMLAGIEDRRHEQETKNAAARQALRNAGAALDKKELDTKLAIGMAAIQLAETGIGALISEQERTKAQLQEEAKRAALQSAVATAQGFLLLALGQPGAVAAFTSAALYAAIAGGSAIGASTKPDAPAKAAPAAAPSGGGSSRGSGRGGGDGAGVTIVVNAEGGILKTQADLNRAILLATHEAEGRR